jgi:hypothetical protein
MRSGGFGSDGGRDGIEAACEIEAGDCGLRRTERADVRINRYLQKGAPTATTNRAKRKRG